MTEPRSCPRCYAPLRPSESPEGLCPKCLLAVAMGEDGLIRTATGEPVPAPPAIADLAPHFPQLEILSLIGRGGAGAVYRAIQRDLGRTVALKVLLLDPERDPTFGERFAREARAMASLTHPNIAGVHDAGRAGRYWYLILEFIDGPNLRQLIQARDLPASEALDVVRQICSALEYAHGEGIVHRDIKPENVLVDARGHVKLVDFGLAKLLRPELTAATLTRSAQAMGTWHYMAPEQLRRPLEVDHRADIYSLGVVLYELLTGEIPRGRYEPASRRAHTDQRLDAIVDRALEQDPARRYQQARGVREDMERVSTGTEAHDPSSGTRRDRHAARRKTGHGLKDRDPEVMRARGQGLVYGCGCLLLAALLLLLATVFLTPGEPERDIVATTVLTSVLPTDVSPGARRILDVLVPSGQAPPALIGAAEKAWSQYVSMEVKHARIAEVESPGRSWIQVEIRPLASNSLRVVESALFEAVERELGAEASVAASRRLEGNTLFPGAEVRRLLEIGALDDERSLVWEGGVQTEIGPDSPPEAALKVLGSMESITHRDWVELPWDLEELGYSRTLRMEALWALLEAEREYFELERAHLRTEPSTQGSYVVYVIDPFQERRQAAIERLKRELQKLEVRTLPDFDVLMPFGGRVEPVRVWQETTKGGPKVSLQLQAGTWFTSPPGGAPGYQLRFLQRVAAAQGIAPFGGEEVGLGAVGKTDALAAVVRAWGRYLEEEARHFGVTDRREDSTHTPISSFRTERGAILDDLVLELATIDAGWSANGGSPLLLDELFEFGYDASEIEVRVRPDGRFEVRTKRGEAERTQVLDELGWRYNRFAPHDAGARDPAAEDRSSSVEPVLDPIRLGLPADLSSAGRAAIARAEERFGELLVLQRQYLLRAAGGQSSPPRWPTTRLPDEPPIGGLVSRVPEFGEARAALLGELFTALEAEPESFDRERVAALVAPLGARDEIVHAGTWASHYFLVAAAHAGGAEPRLVWGGREIDPRLRAFFQNDEQIIQDWGTWNEWTPASDSPLDLRELRGSRIRPGFDGVVNTDVDLVYPSAGAEYLLAGDASTPTLELVVAAEDAWNEYTGLLMGHLRASAWSVGETSYVQVDLDSFATELEAWRAKTGELLTRAGGAAELPELPGDYPRAELRLEGTDVTCFVGSSAKPILDVLRSMVPASEELEAVFAPTRPLDVDLVDAAWPWTEIAPPASFSVAIHHLFGRYRAVEQEHTEARISRLGPGVELFIEPFPDEAQSFRDELTRLVSAAASTERAITRRREVDAGRVLAFGQEPGRVLAGWSGERQLVLEVWSGETLVDREAWPVGLERLLAPDLAERARLWCAPEELGFDRPLSAAGIWTVARARWDYLREVSMRRRTVRPPQPVLPQPEGSRRQLRLEGPVVNLDEFAAKRRGLLDQLLLDLRALDEEPADAERLELMIAPFGRQTVDLAISRDEGRLTIWGEVRESGSLELPEEDRLSLVYEGPVDDWRWVFWSR